MNCAIVRRARFLCLVAMLIAACCVFQMGCGEDVPQKSAHGGASADQSAKNLKPLDQCKILLVHSYHPEYPWVASITSGVRKRLEGTGVQLEIFYMDTKRKTDEKWKIESGNLAAEKVEEYKPDLVIVADDNAQQHFAKKYVGKSLPIVFCGVNSDPGKYGYPAANVTGIIERPHFGDTLEYAAMFLPIKKVAIISDDDPTSVGALNFMKQEYLLEADRRDFEIVEWKIISDFDDWKATVERCNREVDALGIYMYHTIKEKGNPISMEPKVVMEWTARNVEIPTMGYFDFGIIDGQMVGIVESGEEHGEKAAEYALAILKGVDFDMLPVVKAHIGIKMLNRLTAEKLGLKISDKVSKNAVIVPEG